MKINALVLSALALGAATLGHVAPAMAQDAPIVPGEYVDVTEVTIDDGHMVDYANFLATKWKAQEEFAKAQGWITGYEVLANTFKRANEADIYLLIRYKSLPDAAEMARREKIVKEHVKMDDTAMDADSASRAKFRHITNTELFQVMNIK